MPLDNSSSYPEPALTCGLAEDPSPDVMRGSGRNIWALLDQVLISGSNFVTMVLIVRSLGWDRAGNFTHIHSLLLLLNTLQIALIIQPMNVLAATLRGEPYRKFTSSLAVGQVLLALILSVVVGAAAAVTHAMSFPIAPLLVALNPAILAWQLQEFVRRVLYCEDRYRTAFINDLLCYGGQMVLMGAIFLAGRRGGHALLNGPLAFYIIALTSALGATVGGIRIRRSLRGAFDISEWRRSWNFGRWLAGSEVLNFVSSVHLNQYIVSAAMSATAYGAALRVVQQLFGPMRVMAYFLGNILPIRFSRTLHHRGAAAMNSQLIGITAKVMVILIGYCALVWIFAGPLLRIYGTRYSEQVTALRLYGVSAAIGYGGMVLLAALMAQRKTHLIFVTYVASALSTLIFGWPLAREYGVSGGAINMIISSTIVVGILGWSYWRQYRTTAPTIADEVSKSQSPAEVGALTMDGATSSE